MSVAGKMNLGLAIDAAALGSALGNLVWFYFGRYGGNRALNLLSRISLEPDSCVRRTQDLFARYGVSGIVDAKFVPGLGALASPLAGSSGKWSAGAVDTIRIHVGRAVTSNSVDQD